MTVIGAILKNILPTPSTAEALAKLPKPKWTPLALREPPAMPVRTAANTVTVPAEWNQVAKPLQSLLNQVCTFQPNSRQQFYFYGSVGAGKTSATACIWRGWIDSVGYFTCGDKDRKTGELIRYQDKGTAIWFTSAPYLIPELVYSRLTGESRGILERMRRSKFVVLDDIGWRGMTDAQRDALRDIIETRDGLPTIWTGNFAPDELGEVLGDERISSRLLKHCDGVAFEGEDKRMHKMNVHFA